MCVGITFTFFKQSQTISPRQKKQEKKTNARDKHNLLVPTV